jgi:hypothetical protein
VEAEVKSSVAGDLSKAAVASAVIYNFKTNDKYRGKS